MRRMRVGTRAMRSTPRLWSKAAITHQDVSAAQGGKELGRQTGLTLETIAGDTSQQGTASDAEKRDDLHDRKTRAGMLRVGLGKAFPVFFSIRQAHRGTIDGLE